MKKLTKKQKAERKERFKEDYGMKIYDKYRSSTHEHFIKLNVNGFEMDYYPGAGRLNTIINGRNNWSDIEPDDFLDFIGVEKNLISEDEVSFLNDMGIFNDDDL